MKKKAIHNNDFAYSCFFRTTVSYPYKKAILKIIDSCNLHCMHCFVSATSKGNMMSLDVIEKRLIRKLLDCNVISVTLTGGEPFLHPDIIDIVKLFSDSKIGVTICTNATLIDERQLKILSKISNVSINVSLDGYAPESHGKFRGNKESFQITIDNIKLISKYGLLKGILVTPNNLSKIDEYQEICDFAIDVNAKYILMNPLSNYGRGIKSKEKYSANESAMNNIKYMTELNSDRIELNYVRFPNVEKKILASCEAGNILYVFVNGDTTVCPYLIFATNTPNSKHKPSEFIVGNILDDPSFEQKLNNYDFHSKFKLGSNTTCQSCNKNDKCGKGCPAAIISLGQSISGVDNELCPIKN